MEEKSKRKYEKPKATKICLDAECVLLAGCKTSGTAGPDGSGCPGTFGSCNEPAS
jgi:uncharacterized ferredoxin-like protein